MIHVVYYTFLLQFFIYRADETLFSHQFGDAIHRTIRRLYLTIVIDRIEYTIYDTVYKRLLLAHNKRIKKTAYPFLNGYLKNFNR